MDRFLGKEINGTWLLHVSDNADDDRGSLNSWGIEAEVESAVALRVESRPALDIPDNDINGVTDSIHVNSSRSISDLQVEVDISHSWRGDLVVRLTGPGGQSITLHEREGGSADNVQRSYNLADTPELSVFVGQSMGGDWSLTVVDQDAFVSGKFSSWALNLS